MEIPSNYPEQYWHCYVKVNSGGSKTTIAILNDLKIDELWQQVVEPWYLQKAFTVDGIIIRDHEKVQEIKITQTQYPQSYYAEQHNANMRSRNIIDMKTNRKILPISKGNDHTHQFLFSELAAKSSNNHTALSNNKIFIVHGHDEQAKETTARFIEKLGLSAIILHEQASSGKTIIEKIEEHANVGFAIVLYTPCDIGGLAGKSLKPRARQNVVFEHGYFIGKLGRQNVCALVKGDVDIPNDISGIVYIPLDSHEAWHIAIAKELRKAGYEIDMNKVIEA